MFIKMLMIKLIVSIFFDLLRKYNFLLILVFSKYIIIPKTLSIMICAHFQLEVRYTPILDFSSSYRSLLAPFSRLTTSIEIGNENKINELVYFNFEEDKFKVICGFDRIVFITEGELTRFTQSAQSPVKLFFDIYEKVRTMQAFGKINGCFSIVHYLQSADPAQDVSKDFEERFLTIKNFFNKSDNKYHEVCFSAKKGKKQQHIIASTFDTVFINEKADKFFPFSKDSLQSLRKQKGYHFMYQQVDGQGIKLDFEFFKTLVNEGATMCHKLLNHGKGD